MVIVQVPRSLWQRVGMNETHRRVALEMLLGWYVGLSAVQKAEFLLGQCEPALSPELPPDWTPVLPSRRESPSLLAACEATLSWLEEQPLSPGHYAAITRLFGAIREARGEEDHPAVQHESS